MRTDQGTSTPEGSLVEAMVSRTISGYVLAVVLVSAAAVLRWAFPQLLEQTAFLAFYPAVVATAMFGGFGPGVLATLASTLCYALWFSPTPYGADTINSADLIRMGLFATGGTGVSLLARLQRLAHQRQRRQAQAAMEQAAFRQAVMANMGEGLFTINRQGLVTYMNQAAEDLLGWTGSELLGRPIHETTHRPGPDGSLLPVDECAECRVLQQYKTLTNEEDLFIRKDRTSFPVLYSSAPIVAEGRMLGQVVVFRDLTAQKQAEAGQRQGQERFAAFMRHLSGAAWMKDLQGGYIFANPKAGEIFGLPLEQIQGKTDDEILPRDTARRLQENDRQALTQGVVEAVEVFARPDGLEHHYMVSKFVVPGPGGEAACLGGVAFDITELKRAEEALRASEQHTRTLFNAIDEGFCIIEVIFDENQKPIDYRFLDLNPAFRKQTGLVDAKGKTIRELVPLHEEHWFEIYGRIALTGESIRFENRADQLGRWYDVYAFRFGRPEDRQVAILFTDILERKRAEEALRESEERFRILADNSPVILWMTNTDGGNHFVNRTYREFFGATLEQVQGENWRALVHPDDDENYVRSYSRAVEERGPFACEARMRRWDGVWRWIVSHADPRFTQSGEFLGHVGISVDITDRKQAEEELREINRTLEQRVAERTAEAEQRAEELSALAGELARAEGREQRRLAQWLHDDLQQLLVAAKMQIGAAQGATSEQDSVKLLQKASQLIDESIGQSRSMTAELSPPILHERGLIPGLEQLSRWIEEKHNLRVLVETTAGTHPENQEAAVVLFGATRELLFNVAKHAGVSEARVTLAEEEGLIRLTVEDEGAGFDPTLVREGTRSGFGLLNVRERLRSIGGDLRVQSAPGHGTRVELVAPARRAEVGLSPTLTDMPASKPSRAAAREGLAGQEREGRIRILLVDDHKMVREGLAGLLGQEADIEVAGQAGDGQEAVELARQLQPDIITMDISMPGMNGIEATRSIKGELPRVRVIGLSMHGDLEQGAAMSRAGADAYLNKGGPSEELLLTIRKLARGKPE